LRFLSTCKSKILGFFPVLQKILAKLLEKGNTIGPSIKVVQVYDIGDVDKTKLMIEKIDKTLDELVGYPRKKQNKDMK
jgi:hypothetical protein